MIATYGSAWLLVQVPAIKSALEKLDDFILGKPVVASKVE